MCVCVCVYDNCLLILRWMCQCGTDLQNKVLRIRVCIEIKTICEKVYGYSCINGWNFQRENLILRNTHR